MKNPERVAELIAELRALSETDFERRRIDVLKRDFASPPTVEVIDDTHQRFNGIIYTKRNDGHFSKNAQQIHRDVYNYCVGDIPEDYVIHHIDWNSQNNCAENLLCLPKNEHPKIHFELEKETTCEVCGKIFTTSVFRPSSFCSPQCRHKHDAELQTIQRKCVVCGKEFSCRKSSKQATCSASCAFKNRQQPKEIHAVCAVCGKEFTTIRKGVKYCSQKCRVKAGYERTKIPRVCPVCGKEFMSPKNPVSTCCSMKCSWVYRRQSLEQR